MCLIDIKHASTLNISSKSRNTEPCSWSLPCLCSPGWQLPHIPQHVPSNSADTTTNPSKGRCCLLLPAKWKSAIPTLSALTCGSSAKNVNVQWSHSGLQAICIGDAETLLKQMGSFCGFSADFCPLEPQFNHITCQYLLFLSDPKSTHSSKKEGSALLMWAIKDKKTGGNFSLSNLWQFRKNLYQ